MEKSKADITKWKKANYNTGQVKENLISLLLPQATRLEDQRSSLPLELAAPTVPDEDFLSLIMRVQSSRIDEQRSNLPEDSASGSSGSGRSSKKGT